MCMLAWLCAANMCTVHPNAGAKDFTFVAFQSGQEGLPLIRYVGVTGAQKCMGNIAKWFDSRCIRVHVHYMGMLLSF